MRLDSDSSFLFSQRLHIFVEGIFTSFSPYFCSLYANNVVNILQPLYSYQIEMLMTFFSHVNL